MNRLIIIGNGYDRSCGLKSGYDDFIVHYLKGHVRKFIQDNEFECANLTFSIQTPDYQFNTGPLESYQREYLLHELDAIKNIDDLLESERIYIYPGHINKGELTYYDYIKIECYDSLLGIVLNNELSNPYWVDFESAYYQRLKDIVLSSHSDSEKEIELEALNEELTFIKKSLNEFLKIQLELRAESLSFKDCNKENLLVECLYGPLEGDGDYRYSRAPFAYKVMVLNFNYTTLFEDHVNQFINSNQKVHDEFQNSTNRREFLNIHGILHDVEGSNYPHNLLLGQNAMIFGYGDEENEDYQKIENSEIDEYFFNIKSFYYSLNDNYKKLLNFLKKGDFEVYSIGHSLGVSDRTMLREIFMNINCKSIQLFHKEFTNGSDEENLNDSMKSYFKNVIRLSRHFRQNHHMRSRLEPYRPEYKIPQYIESIEAESKEQGNS